MELKKIRPPKLYCSWCFYLLVVADYNILDADVYTLRTVTIFLLHISTLILVSYLYYLYSLFSTSHKESPQVSITTEQMFEIWGPLISVKIIHGQNFIIVKAY